MTTKEKFIQSILLQYHSGISLEDILWAELTNYELQEKCFEVSEINNNQMYLKNFIGTKKLEGLSDKTLAQYYRMTNNFLLDVNKNANEITKEDVLSYLANYKIHHHISNTTLMNMKRYLSAFFTWMEDNDYILKSPMKGIKTPKIEKVVKKAYSNKDIELMRQSASTIRNRLLIELLYSTGCRVTEIEYINITDINFAEKSILIHGKGSKDRIVYYSDVTEMYLEAYLSTRTDSNPALFVHSRGKTPDRLHKDGIGMIIRKNGNLNHIKAYPHRFRRTFITNAIDNGMPIQDVAKLAGHSKIDTTQIYYDNNNEKVKLKHDLYLRG